MDIPPEWKQDESLILKTTIYGLVEIARQIYIKLIEALKCCDFKETKVDPCFWIKNSSSGIVLMTIYVDDCWTIGTVEAMNEVIEASKGHRFGLKNENAWADFLSYKIVRENEKGRAWIM